MKKSQIPSGELVGIASLYPTYSWRIWTRRFCLEAGCDVLSASSFFLDIPNEYLFSIPDMDCELIDALIDKLNARSGWDNEIMQWQSGRLDSLIKALPKPTAMVVGHA